MFALIASSGSTRRIRRSAQVSALVIPIQLSAGCGRRGRADEEQERQRESGDRENPARLEPRASELRMFFNAA